MEYDLMKAYDCYNDFERNSFFTVNFNLLPSKVFFEAKMKESKENMVAVIETLGLDEIELKEVFKKWKTKNVKNTSRSKDFPNEYLLKSESKKVILWISLDTEELFVDFLYDGNNTDIEEWVLAKHHALRQQFGEKKAPSFKVLSRNQRAFFTEEIQIDDLHVNIEKLYNDDFIDVNEIITESIESKASGLILLHGAPGTGKTSYIKHLISSYEEKTFIFIQNEFVSELLQPEFVSFLLDYKNCILIIEDAEKVVKSRENFNESSVVSTILQLTDGLFSDYLNIKIICTFNTSIEKVDKALFRKGRMIANYEFKPLAQEKSEKLLESLGHESNDEEMTLADIFNFNKKGFEKKEQQQKIGF